MRAQILELRDFCLISHELFRLTNTYDPALTEYVLELWKNNRGNFVKELGELGTETLSHLTFVLKSLESDEERPAEFQFQKAADNWDCSEQQARVSNDWSIGVRRELPTFLKSEQHAQNAWVANGSSEQLPLFKSNKGELHTLVESSSRSLSFHHNVKELSKLKSRALKLRQSRGQMKSSTPDELPVLKFQKQLVEAVNANQVVIVVGETGSGKTTQIPQILMRNSYCENSRQIACTQPRRVAAVSVAKRVAKELGCPLGEEVGYSIRFEEKTSPSTRIKYLTDGMLSREILKNPLLSRYSVVVLDEAHERTVSTDILFALIKNILHKRPEFRLVVTSATLDTDKFLSYFGSKAPVFKIPGRTYPVKIKYPEFLVTDYVQSAIASVMAIHESEDPGDILVFLTGREEIDHCCITMAKMCESRNDDRLIILPLYSSLSDEEQSLVFSPAKEGHRKVIFATNIAETSITIDGIKFVIDSGFVKLSIFDARTGMESLKVAPISQAQATQRAGRAGRTSPGTCIRLYTKQAFENEMLDTVIPEILRTNMAHMTLLLKALGIDNVLEFDFLDAPPRLAILKSMSELFQLGAIDDLGKLTSLGKKMAEFPMEPAMAKALIESSQNGCCNEVLIIMSMLGVQSIYSNPSNKKREATAAHRKFSAPSGDHITLLNIYQAFEASNFNRGWCKDNFLLHRELLKAKHIKAQLLNIITRLRLMLSSSGNDTNLILRGLCSGFFRNCAVYRKQDTYTTLIGEAEASIHPSSVLFRKEPDLVLFHSIVSTSKDYMQCISAVKEEWLLAAAPALFQKQDAGTSRTKSGQGLEPLQSKRSSGPDSWRISSQRKYVKYDSNSYAK